MNSIKDLKPTAIWQNFYKLTQVPRPSNHEEKARKFMLEWAKENNIEAEIDEVGNIIMRKPATPGMENRKGVVLQGHLDMVPQKNEDTDHDFEKDPIQAYVDGEWVRAKGTTLGADNGMGVAAGMALSALRRNESHRVFTILGDGECDEGAVWEAAMFARHYHLHNLTAIVDHNHMQAMGDCTQVMDLLDLAEKWRAFGWHVISVENGNDHDQLRAAFSQPSTDMPTCIIANTVKGKGVSYMENTLLWHYRDPQGDAFETAMKELGANDHA